jgi:hypothetical protein
MAAHRSDSLPFRSCQALGALDASASTASRGVLAAHFEVCLLVHACIMPDWGS